MDRSEIYQILASAGLRPQHQFGQNFMVDQNILHAIADAGDIQPSDVILEVGPGVGNLTRLLSQRAAAVLAVDIDYKLMPAAQRYHASLTNITWLNTDVLAGKHEVEPKVITALRELRIQHPAGQLKLVSNLPYNAASPLIAELLVEMWKEVKSADKQSLPPSPSPLPPSPLLPPRLHRPIRSRPTHGRQTRHPRLRPTRHPHPIHGHRPNPEKNPRRRFWPPPKIQSALVVVQPNIEKIAQIQNAPALQLLLQGIFSHRRQTLGNALKHHLADRWPDLKKSITNAGFDITQRGEDLPLESFQKLAELTTPPDAPTSS